MLLAAVLLVAGCDHGKRRTVPPPSPKQSFLALDAEHQRLVRDYQPVSAALTAYELDYRGWRAGKVAERVFLVRAASFRGVVAASLGRVRRDPATGETARAKRVLVSGLGARVEALEALPSLERYGPAWSSSVVDARRGLTILQDIRDRARLIPLPEDSVS